MEKNAITFLKEEWQWHFAQIDCTCAKIYKNCALDKLYILEWYCGHRLENVNKKEPKTLENLPIE